MFFYKGGNANINFETITTKKMIIKWNIIELNKVKKELN